MKLILNVVAIVFFFVSGPLSLHDAFAVEVSGNEFCPVMKGERVRKDLFVDYNGRRVYLCCRSCVGAFKKNPERYLPNLNDPT